MATPFPQLDLPSIQGPDPFGQVDAIFGQLGLPRRKRRESQPVEEPSPEEQQSLLQSALGGLQYFAETLDKPGAAVRGSLSALAGGSAGGGLLNLIPFSDTLGITNPAERVYGRELLNTWGIAPPNKPGISEWIRDPTEMFWDVAGFGVEVATDPLLGLRGPAGALTSKGLAVTAAKKVKPTLSEAKQGLADAVKGLSPILGTTPAARAVEIEQGLRGFVGYKLPFAKEPLFTLGAGSKRMAEFYRNMTYNPLWRNIRAIWAPSQRGQRTYAGALASDMGWHTLHQVSGAIQDMAPAFGEVRRGLQTQFNELAEFSRAAGDKVGADKMTDFIRYLHEGGQVDQQLVLTGEAIRNQLVNVPPNLLQEADKFSGVLRDYIGHWHETKNLLWDHARSLGLPGEWLDDIFTGHVPRLPDAQLAKLAETIQDRRLMTVYNRYANRRKDIHRDWPGGTLVENRLAMNDLVSGTAFAPVKSTAAAFAKRSPEAVKRGLSPGDIVYLADRNDYGRLLGGAEKQGRVLLVKLDGTQRTVSAPWEVLNPVPDLRRVPETLAEALPPAATSKQIIRANLEAWLEQNDPAYWATLPKNAAGDLLKKVKSSELTGEYMWRHDFEPALREQQSMWQQSLQTATDPAIRTAIQDKLANLPQIETALRERLPETVKYFAKLPEAVRQRGLFSRDYAQDLGDYMQHLALSISNGQTMHNLLSQVAKPIAQFKPEEGMPLSAAWMAVKSKEGKRLLHTRGLATLVERMTGKHFELDFTKIMGTKDPLGNTIVLQGAREMATKNRKAMFAEAGKLGVPTPTVNALNAMVEVMRPASEGSLAKLFDQVTGLYKGAFTLPWLSFHVRNLLDGTWRNWASGSDKYSLWELVAAMKHAHDGATGKVALEFADELRDNGTLRGTGLMDLAGKAGEEATGIPSKGFLASVSEPFLHPKRYYAGEGLKAAVNPLNVRGGFTSAGKQAIPFEMGEKAYEWVEYMNRAAPYIALRRKGFTPGQAKYWVDKVQFKYSEKSPFMKKYGRAFLFPGWLSNNIPYQFASLLERPGGRHAQTIRFLGAMQREGETYLPSWMREKFAGVWGEDEESGETHIFRQLGLSVEDLGNIAVQKGHPFNVRSAEKLVSQAHPLLGAGYKLMTGKDPYTGRELKTMYGRTGSVPMDFLLQASPLSRAVNESRFVEDLATGRKPAGLTTLDALTGIKIGTYDLDKWRLIDQQRLMMRLLENEPDIRKFEEVYLPAEKRATAAPSTVKSLSHLRWLQKESKRMKAEQAQKKAAKAGR